MIEKESTNLAEIIKRLAVELCKTYENCKKEFKCQKCDKEISADELGQDTYDPKTLKTIRLCIDCIYNENSGLAQ